MDSRKHPVLNYAKPAQTPFLQGQFWFIAKNILGWLLILLSPVIGIAVPGPGGVPIFLIGFALATIPGKRKMTSHVMRGRPVQVNPALLIGLTTFVTVAASTAIIWYFRTHFKKVIEVLNLTDDDKGRVVALVIGLCIFAAIAAWLGMRLGVVVLNWFLRTLPKARRFLRPWLKKYGIALLPPRRKTLSDDGTHANENEILEFSPDSHQRLKNAGRWFMNWGRRAGAIGLTLYIFFAILKPVVAHFDQTSRSLSQIRSLDLLISVSMYAAFLALPRAMNWRSALAGLGSKLRAAPALRVWITSELTRYLPGRLWQMASRVRLVRPYGIRGSVCVNSQVVELAVLFLANLCIGIPCVLYWGYTETSGFISGVLLALLCLTPLLALLLHPRLFYGATDWVLQRYGKPAMAHRLKTGHLIRLFAVAMFGVCWQAAALWMLLHRPLTLDVEDAWILAGAYSLAWMAGVLAVWAPGGLGIREIALVGTLGMMLPPTVREHVSFTGAESDPTVQAVALLARVWTIVAELIIASLAFSLDWRGVVNEPAAQDTPESAEAEDAINLRSD